MRNDKIGVGIYVFMQQLGDDLNFKRIVAEILTKINCRNLELFFPMENAKGIPDFLFAKKELDEWEEIGKEYALKFPSAYINYVYHDGMVAEHAITIDRIMAYSAKVLPELKVFVSNPVPLDWNDPSVQKTDEQLETQQEEIILMSEILGKNGQILSYHFHESELRNNAKEMLFTLRNTRAQQLMLTLDVNWCLNGGYSPEKVIDEFGDRINNLHLRSSTNRIWDSVLENGDENNIQLLQLVQKLNYQGNYIIEISDSPGMNYELPLANRLDQSMKNLFGWLG